MRARVYDKNQNKYYLSEVYGELNCVGKGHYHIVDKMDNRDYVVLVQYLDFSAEPPYDVNVELIQDSDSCPWPGYESIRIEGDKLCLINDVISEPMKCHSYWGLKQIWDNKEGLVELIEKGCIHKSRLNISNICTKLPDWNYIESQEDIDNLMEQFSGFEDSILKELSYVSGDYGCGDGTSYLTLAHEKKIKLIFDSDYADEIEIILLAPRYVQLVPPGENRLPGLLDGSIFIKDCRVYFYDSRIDSIPESYGGTYMIALGMIWRFVK